MPPPDAEFSRWFAEEVQPHEPALRGWLRARFPSLPDVDDLVQEAYARLLRVRQSGAIACPRGFLFITARNLALNQLRHLRHEPRWQDEPAEDPTALVFDEQLPVPESLEKSEDIQLLVRAIQSLPERCRQVLTLRKIYGLSQRETAARLGISEPTVETQGAIGLRKCIEFFRRHGHRP